METRCRRSVRRILALGLVLTGAYTVAGPALAAPHAGPHKRTAHDSATAARPADSSVSEAERTALHLGTRRIASELLRRRPSQDLRAAAAGKGGQKLLWPLSEGNFVRGFGYVRKVRKDLPHLGVDIAAKSGTPIHAAADGIVAYADHGLKGYGNLMMLVHADGAVTSYAHCTKLLARPGERVKQGQTIATVGSTGISQGPHLHFELRTEGRPRNPMPRFDRTLEQPRDTPVLLSAL